MNREAPVVGIPKELRFDLFIKNKDRLCVLDPNELAPGQTLKRIFKISRFFAAKP
jgi:hypothetical protein